MCAARPRCGPAKSRCATANMASVTIPSRTIRPVTAADRECEQVIALALEEAFPDDGLLGEEGAVKASRSGRRWIIDPIDGTRDYVRGIPVWAHADRSGAGWRSRGGRGAFRGRGETYFASRGGGAFCNDIRIRISNINTVARGVPLSHAASIRSPSIRFRASCSPGRSPSGRCAASAAAWTP